MSMPSPLSAEQFSLIPSSQSYRFFLNPLANPLEQNRLDRVIFENPSCISPLRNYKMGSIQVSPDTSFDSNEFSAGTSLGYDFEDSQTRAQLELIDDLQKLGVSNYLGLPQVSFWIIL
jgi:hypothetical protein